MLTVLLWFLAMLNAFIWFGNWALNQSNDKSGSGMVLMITVPLGIIVGLLSLVVIGFAT